MSFLDPHQAFDDMVAGARTALTSSFPVQGRTRTLHLTDIAADATALDPADVTSQKEAKLAGKSWSVPLRGRLELKDNETGKVLDSRVIKLMDLPRMTNRLSFIHQGQEHQISNQWQLKPGVYTRRRQNGELESRFNVTGRAAFDMTFDPESKRFEIEYKKAHLPAYPLLKAMGVTDDHLEKTWGYEVLAANRDNRRNATTLAQFHRTSTNGATPADHNAAVANLQKVMAASKIRPEVTEQTLGKRFEHVEGDTLLLASKKLLDVHGGHPEDDRDSLLFKSLRGTSDFLHDQLKESAKSLAGKLQRQMNKGESPKLSNVFSPGLFNVAVRSLFQSSLVNPAKQINPLDMTSSALQTTIMGPGGIRSEMQVTDEAKMINPSHLGYIDPLVTPEGCHDPKTEVLTRSGWKRWPAVTDEDEFACLVSGKLHFAHASRLVIKHHVGLLYGAKTSKHRSQLDYLVTPQHRMWVKPYDSAVYRFETAEEVHGKYRQVLLTHAPYAGSYQEWFELPEAPSANPVANLNTVRNTQKVRYVDWGAFYGWFLSEGHVFHYAELQKLGVKLFQSYPLHKTYCKEIEDLLHRMGLPYTMQERVRGRRVYTISRKQLVLLLLEQGSSPTRFIPEYFFEAQVSVREALLDALLKGDGRKSRRRKDGRMQNQQVFTTTSPRLAEGVERLAAGLGYGTTHRVYEDKREERYLAVHEVRLLRISEKQVHRKYQFTKPYDGLVYCATVPGGLLYVRRGNGIPHWSGNSSTGVSLRLPLGVRKIGDQPHIPLHNIKTGKVDWVDPVTFNRSKVVFADQVHFHNGVPTPIASEVSIAAEGNKITKGRFADADYVMKDPSLMFNPTSALVPFVSNNSGNRVSFASRHMEQSISLQGREAPLVQVRSPNGKTFEDVLGRQVSHSSAVDGVVTKVTPQGVHIKGADGKDHVVHTYDHYPLNDAKSVLHSEALVKVGDPVKAGQVVADSNYTRDGHLALGRNMHVAYMPFHGLNFEDAVVVSEEAAKKLSSVHMHKHELRLQDDTVLGRKKFELKNPGLFSQEQTKALGDDGVVRVGSRVRPGDPLVLAMQPYTIKDRVGLAALRKSMTDAHADKSVRWEGEHEGEVVGVHRGPEGIQVHVKTLEPLQVGDKLSMRHGGKGIVSTVLPTKEMPHDKDGKPVEILYQPVSVGGRMNVGQILETMAGKIAQKTGQPYVVHNFDPHTPDWTERMRKELNHHGIKDTEELFDPKTKLSYGQIFTGPQYYLKLVHQVDKKESVRSGMGLPKLPSSEKYDSMTMQPASGGGTGGQSYGQLGMYALLAHGATNLMRAAMTYKSEGEDPETNEHKRWKSQHAESWLAMQKGLPLPPPKPTFAFHRFTEMLKGAGINVEKQGSQFLLSPLTDKQILSMSKGEVSDPTAAVHAKFDPKINHYKPIPGGLFDEKVTGGHGSPTWSHVRLAEPLPNPIFEDPIKKLTGLTGPRFEAILQGHMSVDPATGKETKGKGVTGGAGIKAMLDAIDVGSALEETKKQLKAAPATAADALYKKARYLKALQEMKMKPSEAYVLHHLPVLPPKLRPLSVMDDGALRFEDTNGLYMKMGQLNGELKSPVMSMLPEEEKANLRAGLYDSVKAIFGVGALPEGAKMKGLLQQIHGTSPKSGVVQKGLLSRRQDMVSRATIIPGPDLGLDQVGLPRDSALVQFRPFVVRQLVVQGTVKNEADAQVRLSEHHRGKEDPMVWKALEQVVAERPVLIKRDPALHRHSIQAFNPVLIPGKAIKLHPLATGGFNADFDGDSVDGPVLVIEGERCRSVEIRDFPRIEGSKVTRPSGVEEYEVPEGVQVFGQQDSSMKPYRVTHFSVHPECKVWEITLSSGRKIRCSPDHSLATLDPFTLRVTPTSPREAVGKAVPCLGLLRGSTSSVWQGKEATADLGWELGLLLAAAENTKTWSDELLELLGGTASEVWHSALIRPLEFRSMLVGGYLSKRIDKTKACVHRVPDPEGLSLVMSSIGMPSRVSGSEVRVSPRFLRKTKWMRGRPVRVADGPWEELVPFPVWAADECSRKVKGESGWVSRSAVLEEVERNQAEKRECSGYFAAWLRLVTSTELRWEKVVSARETDETTTLYDLTVEESLNFVMGNGALVWDTMSVYVPSSHEEVQEARRMMPSKNLFLDTQATVAFVPSMEAQLGLHKLSKVNPGAPAHTFATQQQVADALALGKLNYADPIHLQHNGKQVVTTPGRVLLSQHAPGDLQTKVLTDLSMRLHGGGLRSLFEDVAKNHQSKFATVADGFKTLGYQAATGMISSNLTSHKVIPIGAHSFKLDDFLADKATRDPILNTAHKEVERIQAGAGTSADKDRRTVDTYLQASAQIRKDHLNNPAAIHGNNLRALTDARVKPSEEQYQQMRLAPVIMSDSRGQLIPTPITRSYGEGLTQAQYWIGAYGARSGTVKKVQEVQDPGYMTKLLQNTSMSTLIEGNDCGTKRGIHLHANHSDVADRHLAAPHAIGNLKLEAGTLLDAQLLSKIRAVNPDAELLVRSPLTCGNDKGICPKCFGLNSMGHHHHQGTNIGVMSAHALGERAVQLTLKAFHCLHEHTVVLCRRGEKVFHTTLGALFESATPSHLEDNEEVRDVHALQVWDREGWVNVRNVRRHPQQPGTAMVLVRTANGTGVVSQDNHPHMLHQGGPIEMVEASEIRQHAAVLAVEPPVSPNTPPLTSGWLAGMYCAEGSLVVRQEKGKPYLTGIQISQKRTSPAYARIGDALKAEYGQEVYSNGRYYQLYGCERAKHYERSFGRYSRNTGLSEGWTGYGLSWLADFVAGVIDGDGTLQPNHGSQWFTCRIDTTSWLLAQQVHAILQLLKIPARVLRSPWRKASLHQGFAVVFSVSEAAQNALPACAKLQGVKGKPTLSWPTSAEEVDYVRALRFEAPPLVYDIETESHTFFANRMLTHNSGGVATDRKGGATGAFQRLEQLTFLPDKIPNSAVHAHVSGKVEAITPTSTGHEVTIGGTKHFVGKDIDGVDLHKPIAGNTHVPGYQTWKGPQVGAHVERGELLSDPNRTMINPHRLYEATGDMHRVQHFLTDEMHKLYEKEGVRRRAVETMVRAMGDVTKIEDAHEHADLLRGQFYSRASVDKLNRDRHTQGLKPIEHKPVLMGVNLLPLAAQEDWMAVLNHQKLRGTLMQNAALGAKSDLHGRHPVPGLMYGAEFGKPRPGSNSPY